MILRQALEALRRAPIPAHKESAGLTLREHREEALRLSLQVRQLLRQRAT